MKTSNKTAPPNPTKWKNIYWIGIGAIAVSLLIYLIDNGTGNVSNRFFHGKGELFFINYGIAIVYGLVIFVHNVHYNNLNIWKMDPRLFNLFLALALISCFSLNLSIPIFATMEDWAALCIFLAMTPLILMPFLEKFPIWGRITQFFLLGFCTTYMLYFSIYLGPLMGLGLILFFVLGLPLHLLVPLGIAISTIVQFFKNKSKEFHWDKWAYIAGIVLPMMAIGVFVTHYKLANKLTDEIRTEIVLNHQKEHLYPGWIALSQQLPQDGIISEILKGDLFYQSMHQWDAISRIDQQIGKEKTHNPLVSVSELFNDPINISREERLKILKSRYDLRHDTHRRLWSGRDLTTNDVLTHIKVYDDFGMAYVEKTITIRNNAGNRGQAWPEREAFYSFYMPEGSIVTSLSLWVNGVEEKARLTTRGKADSAYTEIVGRQRRDPALLHWQEGNRVTVNVFPCTPRVDRQFKVGFTIPLEKLEDQYILKNVYFDGPDWKKTKETTLVSFASETVPKQLEFPGGFKRRFPEFDEDDKVCYKRTGRYKNYWEIRFKASQLSSQPFVFQNQAYQLQPLQTIKKAFNPTTIYLDINKSWTKQQVLDLLSAFKGKTIYGYDHELFEITNGNNRRIDKMLAYNFSLFPFHKVTDPANSLVITASTEWSPNLDELKNTPLLQSLIDHLDRTKRIPLYHIGSNPTDYIRSLKEFEAFDYSWGSFADLLNTLERGTFTTYKNNKDVVSYENAGFSIVKSNAKNTPSAAPDHLMRLFAYKQVMSEIGLDYFDLNNAASEKVNETANEAFIVTPVTTLIVLETIKDYEQFDIKEPKNSLKNASMSGSGAVPEPHEWLLIFLVTGLVFYFYRRKMMQWFGWVVGMVKQ